MEAVAVDWSGDARSHRRLALARARAGRLLAVTPGLSREDAVASIVALAEENAGELVVGLDFAFSFPCWFLHDRELPDAPALWRLAEEEGETWLAECPPPFWGRPGRRRPVVPAHFRATDLEVPPVAGARPKSPFQIGGAGSVGTASVRGMPHLLVLRRAGFAVWPFDPPVLPVLVEIWPRLFTGPVVKARPRAREALVAGAPAGTIPSGLRAAVASSEHSLDAAVSALALSRADHVDLAGTVEDPCRRLEGEVWRPGGRSAAPARPVPTPRSGARSSSRRLSRRSPPPAATPPPR